MKIAMNARHVRPHWQAAWSGIAGSTSRIEIQWESHLLHQARNLQSPGNIEIEGYHLARAGVAIRSGLSFHLHVSDLEARTRGGQESSCL